MQLAQETQSGHVGPGMCQPHCGKYAMGNRFGYSAEASISEEPGAIVPHAGI